ncbi:MAG: response regulator [Verrucomicrobiota bacterium]|jgi:CheY-like chemotaxis protein
MKKILIIEDDLIIRSIYRRKFEMSGYKVETAEEGTAALALLPKFHPDVIQVDIGLPGMDGVEVIKQIRSWPEFQQTPILVLSSFYRPDLAKEAWKAGASKCVSKMDCTPNLAVEFIEQLLSGENTGFIPKFGTIPLAKGTLDAPGEAEAKGRASGPSDEAKLTVQLDLPPSKATAATPPPPPKAEAPPAWQGDPSTAEEPKLKVTLDLPPSKGTAPTRPTFSLEREGKAPPPAAVPPAPTPSAPAQPAKPAFFGKTQPAPFKPAVRVGMAGGSPAHAAAAKGSTPPLAAEQAPSGGEQSESSPNFRIEIRQAFLKRAPQIQAEVRERINALIRSKSPSDQLNLLRDLEATVSSLASLSGITGFSRISHLSGAMDALIKDLHKKPSQMTASVLRTIAHASDCLNVLFGDLSLIPQDIPQSMLILTVDDEPISRRTISVALSKANLRCIGIEDSRVALTLLQENPFDLIFLDAEMPGLNGFELCAELRKLPTNKSTPVIFVTSLTKFEIRAQSSLSGGNDLIAKPFLMMELAVKALTYLLKPSRSVEAKACGPEPAS